MSARLLDFAPGRHARARIAVECTKGTYIRALAADIGAAVGCGAHLSFLVRTRAGDFEIADSATIEQTQGAIEERRLGELLRPLDTPLGALPAVTLARAQAERARRGGEVAAPSDCGGAAELVRIYDPEGAFIGLAAAQGAQLRPRIVVAE